MSLSFWGWWTMPKKELIISSNHRVCFTPIGHAQAVHLEAELELLWPEVLWHFTIWGIGARLWLLVILNSVHDSFRVVDMPLASWKPCVLVVVILIQNPTEESVLRSTIDDAKAWNSQVTFHTPNSVKMQRKHNRRSMRLEKRWCNWLPSIRTVIEVSWEWQRNVIELSRPQVSQPEAVGGPWLKIKLGGPGRGAHRAQSKRSNPKDQKIQEIQKSQVSLALLGLPDSIRFYQALSG